jgi:branched-chain amino acid transport system substrate-binding protein
MIQLIKCDTKFIGSDAATCATKFVFDDKLHYVIGPIVTANASNPIFTEGKVIAGIIGTANERYTYPEAPYTWVTLMDGITWVDTFYKQMVQFHPEIKTVGLIAHTGAQGDDSLEANELAALAQGYEIVHTSRYQAGALDYYPALTPIVAKNPDAIAICNGGIGDQDLIIKQVRELGYTGLLIGANHGTEVTTIEIAGKEAAEGLMINDVDYSSDLYPDKTHQLTAEFQERLPGQAFNLTHYLGYSAVWFYKQAIEKAGSIDPDEVLKVFDDPTWTARRG